MESPYRFILCGWLVITSFVVVIIGSSNIFYSAGYQQAESDLRFKSPCKDLIR